MLSQYALKLTSKLVIINAVNPAQMTIVNHTNET